MVLLDSTAFERAYIAAELARTIRERLALIHCAARSEPPLSARAVVDVAGRIISKVAARESPTMPLRIVEHRDMWRDAFACAPLVMLADAPGILGAPTGLV
jgi:hypothetical protein